MAVKRMVGSLKMLPAVNRFGDFMASGMFAVLVLAVTSCWTAVMATMIFWPQTLGAEANFATLFRVWCFGYDPIAGTMDMSKIVLALIDPLFFAGLIGMIWRSELAGTLREKRAAAAGMFLAVAAVTGLAVLLIARHELALAEKTAFAEAPVVRSFGPAPQMRLMDHEGREYSYRPGRVTVVSAFFAHCQFSCPLIVKQLRAAVGDASPDVDVLLVTMDPERDTPAVLKARFEEENLGAHWRLLTGPPAAVGDVLDRYQVARARNPDGSYGHSNVIYVADKKGRLAFRLGLDGGKGTQLRRVLDVLVKE